MRHISSLVAGIVIGIIAWMIIGVAQYHLGIAAATGISGRSWGLYWLPLLLFAVAGLLIGLVASTRISPIGPFIAGAGYVLLQLAYVTFPNFLNWLPGNVFGQINIWDRPMRSGMFAVLGLVMLTAVLSVRRWQRWPKKHPEARRDLGATDSATAGSRNVSERGGQFPLADSRPGSATADPGTEQPTRQMPADYSTEQRSSMGRHAEGRGPDEPPGRP
ncbi:MAG: hypothetical protein WCA46_09405 [Actinocatenispora sp.]